MDRLVKDRDEAFIDFVLNDDDKKIRSYCKKYGVPMPKNKRVMACGIYKAVQYCMDIPDDVKYLAIEKCLNLGMSPFIDWSEKE